MSAGYGRQTEGKQVKALARRRHLFRKVCKWIGRTLMAVFLLAVFLFAALRIINHYKYRITAEDGIDETLYVPLGNQQQFIRIRGEDTENPVILWLHGGPAGPDAYINYVWDKQLTDRYTVVFWDQRGCGRTYFRNVGNDPMNRSAVFEQALLDLDNLVDNIEERFAPPSIAIVGHSYGTLLGSRYVLEHGDKVDAYVGVGQVVSLESELSAQEDALRQAREKGDDTAEMQQVFRDYALSPDLMTLMEARALAAPYHKAPREKNTFWLGVRSSFMGFNDLRWFLKQTGNQKDYFSLNRQLFSYIMTADVREYGTAYSVPAGFISGSGDWTTPVQYTRAYYESVTAPDREFILIDGCGHSPQLDAPEEFAAALTDMLDRWLPRTK